MKFIPNFRILAALALALPLTGGLQSTTTINVAKDGSGTIEERTVAGEEFVVLMSQFSQGLAGLLGGDDAAAPPSNPILQPEDDYKKRSSVFGEGVTFVSAEEVKDSKGGAGALVRYRFDDITKLEVRVEDTMSALDTMKSKIPIPIPNDVNIPNNFGGAPITFSFDPGSTASLGVNLPDPDEEAMREATAQAAKTKTPDADDIARASEFLGEMRFSLLVKVDGEVVTSDATHQEGNAATLFALDFGKILADPDAFAKIQALSGEQDVAKAKMELEKVDGMTLEPKDAIEIRFK
jgi:hypothetical protein